MQDCTDDAKSKKHSRALTCLHVVEPVHDTSTIDDIKLIAKQDASVTDEADTTLDNLKDKQNA